VHLTGMHREIDAPQNLVVANIYLQVSNFQHVFILCERSAISNQLSAKTRKKVRHHKAKFFFPLPFFFGFLLLLAES
jgi:hypothetical protein